MPSSTNPRAIGWVSGGRAGPGRPSGEGSLTHTEAMAMASPIPLNRPVVCSRRGPASWSRSRW